LNARIELHLYLPKVIPHLINAPEMTVNILNAADVFVRNKTKWGKREADWFAQGMQEDRHDLHHCLLGALRLTIKGSCQKLYIWIGRRIFHDS
jgi:hypothetical protein